MSKFFTLHSSHPRRHDLPRLGEGEEKMKPRIKGIKGIMASKYRYNRKNETRNDMKAKKTSLSTQLVDLYGRDKYQPHIEVGREYWWCWPTDTAVYRHTHQTWNKIRITYKRAGASFYVLTEFPDYPEQYFGDNTIFAESLEYAQIDPMKDVDWGDRNKSKEYLEKRYCFYDKRTEVLNWDNSKESELDESEIDYFDMFFSPKP